MIHLDLRSIWHMRQTLLLTIHESIHCMETTSTCTCHPPQNSSSTRHRLMQSSDMGGSPVPPATSHFRRRRVAYGGVESPENSRETTDMGVQYGDDDSSHKNKEDCHNLCHNSTLAQSLNTEEVCRNSLSGTEDRPYQRTSRVTISKDERDVTASSLMIVLTVISLCLRFLA